MSLDLFLQTRCLHKLIQVKHTDLIVRGALIRGRNSNAVITLAERTLGTGCVPPGARRINSIALRGSARRHILANINLHSKALDARATHTLLANGALAIRHTRQGRAACISRRRSIRLRLHYLNYNEAENCDKKKETKT